MRERLTAVLLSLVDRMTVEWSFSPSPLMPLISCCFPSAGWLAGWPPIPVPHASNWGLKTAGRRSTEAFKCPVAATTTTAWSSSGGSDCLCLLGCLLCPSDYVTRVKSCSLYQLTDLTFFFFKSWWCTYGLRRTLACIKWITSYWMSMYFVV